MVSIRPLKENDAEQLAFLANNVNIWNNVRDFFPHPYSIEDADFFINLTKNENPRLTFAIDYKGELCGVTGIVKQNDIYSHSAEIGYWIGETFWGKGIATEAVKQLTKYAQTELGYVRLFAGVFEYNKSSMRVLEKCGFQQEGIFKKGLIKNGKIWDEYRFGLVK